jgi:hypothetical protein
MIASTALQLLIAAGGALVAGPVLGGDRFLEMTFEGETATIWIPGDYIVGNEAPDLMELIPEGQGVENWMDIFTVGVLPPSQESPETIRERAQSGFIETCGGEFMTADMDIGSHHGFPATVWMQACEITKSGPSQGRPEMDIFLLIQGESITLALMRGFRYFPSDTQETGRWIDFLKKSHLASE